MTEPLRTVIIDGEPEACDNLKNILTSFITTPVTVSGTKYHRRAQNGAGTPAGHCVPDIEMPNENGFAYLERIAPFSFEVIFVTAYDAYAVKAFKMNAG